MRFSALLVLATMLGAPLSAQASLITYRWSGTFEPLFGDPWNVAPRGTFHASIKVASDAVDLSAALPEAMFTVAGARFVIQGIGATTVSLGDVRFSDNSSVDGDTMTYFGEFELEGVRSVLGSYVVMPYETFAFRSTRVSAPMWGHTTVRRSGYASAGGSPYQSEVAQGSAVSAVPEPASGLLWALIGLGMGRVARHRRGIGTAPARLAPGPRR
jgi:hypothetical protein